MTVERSFWGVFLFYNPYKHYENENKCKIILYINFFVVDLLYQITI